MRTQYEFFGCRLKGLDTPSSYFWKSGLRNRCFLVPAPPIYLCAAITTVSMLEQGCPVLKHQSDDHELADFSA